MKNLGSSNLARRKVGHRSARAKSRPQDRGRTTDLGKESCLQICFPNLLGRSRCGLPATRCIAGATPRLLGKTAWGRNGRHPGLRWGQHPKGRWFLALARQDLFLLLTRGGLWSATLLFTFPWTRRCHFREAVPVTLGETGSLFKALRTMWIFPV